MATQHGQNEQKGGGQMKEVNPIVRTIRIIMVAVLVCCIAVPIALFTRGEHVESVADNRLLKEMPTPGTGTFTDEFEEYMSDRIGLRNEFITGYQWLNDRAFHKMTHPLYEYGKGDYVFFSFTDGGWSEEYLKQFADFILLVQTYAEERGVPFLYVITPSKAAVYPEQIPDSVPPQQESTDILVPLLEERGINYIDLTQPLIDAKEAGVQVFNVVYDAGHWNTEGMHVGSAAVIDKLNEMGVDVDQIDLADYTPEFTLQKTLPSSNYPIEEMTYVYWANEDAAAVDREEYREAIHMDDIYASFWYWQNDRRKDDPSLLMFQGSYFNTQGTMLYNQFSHAMLVHDYANIFRLPYYFEVCDPDVLIFETAAYTTRTEYYDTDKMATIEFPKPFATWADVPRVEMGSIGTLEYEGDSAIADFWVSYDGEPMKAAYVELGGRVYDTIVEEWGVVYFAIDAKELTDTHGRLYELAEDGSKMWVYDFDIAPGHEE